MGKMLILEDEVWQIGTRSSMNLERACAQTSKWKFLNPSSLSFFFFFLRDLCVIKLGGATHTCCSLFSPSPLCVFSSVRIGSRSSFVRFFFLSKENIFNLFWHFIYVVNDSLSFFFLVCSFSLSFSLFFHNKLLVLLTKK